MTNGVVVRGGIGILVVDLATNYILLLRRSKTHDCGKWTDPGGKIDPFETARAAAVREVCEETGLVVKPEHLVELGTYDHIDREHNHHFVGPAYLYALTGTECPVNKEPEKHDQMRMVPHSYALDNLPLCDPTRAAIEMYMKWREAGGNFAAAVGVKSWGSWEYPHLPSAPGDELFELPRDMQFPYDVIGRDGQTMRTSEELARINHILDRGETLKRYHVEGKSISVMYDDGTAIIRGNDTVLGMAEITKHVIFSMMGHRTTIDGLIRLHPLFGGTVVLDPVRVAFAPSRDFSDQRPVVFYLSDIKQ